MNDAVIWQHLFDDDCLNFGCVPSKPLIAAFREKGFGLNMLWTQDDEDLDESKPQTNAIVVFKVCEVSAFGGRSLSASRSGLIAINPDHQEAMLLLQSLNSKGDESTAPSRPSRGTAAATTTRTSSCTSCTRRSSRLTDTPSAN